MKKRHFLKITAVLTAFFIAFDPGSSYASPPRVDSAASLSIPGDLGREEESFRGLSPKTILYIQDAHDSFEAQKNIASLVTHLTEKSGVKTVFEEGYEGPVPTDNFFGFIQNGEARLKVSSFLLDKLRIGGAEFAHINRKTDFNLIGADHLDYYRQNIQAFRDAAKKNTDIEKDLTAILTEIESLVHQKFPKPLREWLDTRDRYEAGQLDLLAYAERGWKILEAQPEGGAAKNSLPLISILLAVRKTPDEALAAKARALEPQELFREITALDKAIAALFTREEKETLLLHYRSALHLLKRLNQIEVSPAEYAASKEILSGLNTRELADFIARESRKSLVLSKAWEENIKTASRFYELAHQRDDAIEQTLRNYLSSTAENTAVLVYGGFHKAGILSILRRLGVSYRVITPHISGTDPVHENYYKKLMAEGVHDYEKSIFPSKGIASTATRPPSLFVETFGEASVQALYKAASQKPGTPMELLGQAVQESRSELRMVSSFDMELAFGELARTPDLSGGRNDDFLYENGKKVAVIMPWSKFIYRALDPDGREIPDRIYKITHYTSENETLFEEAKKIFGLQIPGVSKLQRVGMLKNGGMWMELKGIASARSMDREVFGRTPRLFNVLIRAGELLKGIHQRGVVHGDIKLENLLINSAQELEWIDFGGNFTRGYVALDEEKHPIEDKASPDVDVYSFIMIIAHLLDHQIQAQSPEIATILRRMRDEYLHLILKDWTFQRFEELLQIGVWTDKLTPLPRKKWPKDMSEIIEKLKRDLQELTETHPELFKTAIEEEKKLIHASVHSMENRDTAQKLKQLLDTLQREGALHRGKIAVTDLSRGAVAPAFEEQIETFSNQQEINIVMEGAYLDDCCRQASWTLLDYARKNPGKNLNLHFPVDLIAYPHDFLAESDSREKISSLLFNLESDAAGLPYEIFVDGVKTQTSGGETPSDEPVRVKLYLWSDSLLMAQTVTESLRSELRRPDESPSIIQNLFFEPGITPETIAAAEALIPTPILARLIREGYQLPKGFKTQGTPGSTRKLILDIQKGGGNLEIVLKDLEKPSYEFLKIPLSVKGKHLGLGFGHLNQFSEAKAAYPSYSDPVFAWWFLKNLVPFAKQTGFDDFDLIQGPLSDADLRKLGFKMRDEDMGVPFWIYPLASSAQPLAPEDQGLAKRSELRSNGGMDEMPLGETRKVTVLAGEKILVSGFNPHKNTSALIEVRSVDKSPAREIGAKIKSPRREAEVRVSAPADIIILRDNEWLEFLEQHENPPADVNRLGQWNLPSLWSLRDSLLARSFGRRFMSWRAYLPEERKIHLFDLVTKARIEVEIIYADTLQNQAELSLRPAVTAAPDLFFSVQPLSAASQTQPQGFKSELRASYSETPAAAGLNLTGTLLSPDLFVASPAFTKLLTFKEFFFSTAPQGTRRGLIDDLINGRKTFSPRIQDHFRGPSPARRAFFIAGSPANPASEYSEYEIYKTLAGLLLNMLEEPEKQIFSDFYKQHFSSDRQFVKVIRGMGDFRGIVVSESYVNSSSVPAIIQHEQFHMTLDDFLKAALKTPALRKDFEDVRKLLPVFVNAGGLESLLASLGKLSAYSDPIEALKKGNFSFTEEFLAQTLYMTDAPEGLESAFAALKSTLARIESENPDFQAGMRVLRRLQPSSDAKAAEKNELLNRYLNQKQPEKQTSPAPEPRADEGLASFSSESLRDLYVKAPQNFISNLTLRLQQHFTRAGLAGGALSVGNLIIIQVTEGASIRSASLDITGAVDFEQLSQKTQDFLTLRSELRTPEEPAELEGFNSSTPIWDFLTAFGIDPAQAKVEALEGPWGRVSAAKDAVFGMQPGQALNEAVMESALDIFNADNLISEDLPEDRQASDLRIDSLYLLTYQKKPAAIVWNLEEAKSKPILFYPFVGKNQQAYWTDKNNSGEDRQPSSAIYTRLMEFLNGFYQRSGTLDGAATGKSFDILRADTDGMTLLKTFQDKVIFPTVFDPGAHPSTASLIEHLNRLEDRGIFKFDGKTVSEIGTGSGWIGSQAALLGASKVHVYDLSLIKAANANATAKRLGTQDRVTSSRSKSADILPPSNLYIWNAPDFSDSAIRDDDGLKTAGVSASINNEISPADVEKVFAEIRQSAPSDALLLVRILHSEFEGLQKIAQASGWDIHPLNYDLARGVLAGGRFVLLKPAPLYKRSELRSQEAPAELLGFDRSTPLWDFLSAFGIDPAQTEVETLDGPWGRVPAAQHEAFGVAAGNGLREAVLESAYAVFDSREIRERLKEQSISEDQATGFLYLLTFERVPVSLVWAIPGDPFQPLFYYPLTGPGLEALWKGSSPLARTSISSPPLPQDLEFFIRAHHKKDFGKNPVLQGGLPLSMQSYGLPGGTLREFEEGLAFPTVFSLNHQTSKGLVETAGQLIAAGIFSIEGETVSEVGTGAGWIAAQMALRGAADVHAYDLNLMKAANAAQTARRHGVAGRFHAYRAHSAKVLPSSRLYLWNIPDFADSASGVLDHKILDQSESIAVNNRIPVESVRQVFQELSGKARADSLFLVRIHPWDEPAFFEMLKNSGWEMHPSSEKEIQNPGRGGSFFLLRPELEEEAAARRAGEEALSRDFRGTPETLEALRAVAKDLQPDQHGFPVLLIEGLPGSGKSSRAEDLKAVLKSQGRKAVVIHSEHYLLQGRYNKPIRAFFGLLTRWIARQPNDNLFDYAARAFVDTSRVKNWISDINALRAEGGLLTIDRDQKIQEKLTPDTVLIIEGTLSSHLFRKLSGAKKLFLDVPVKTIRHQFVKRTLFEAAGGAVYGSFKARLMAPGIAVGFFRRHAARFDFILKTQASGAVSLIRPRIASATSLPAGAFKDPSRSELRNTHPLDLTPEEKNLILESARSGFHRQGAVDETTPIWFFGEQEVVEPFIAPFFSQTSDKALPSEFFQDKKVLVMPGYGNLPFVLRAFGAREVVAADRDPVTIAWQKLKWKSGVENINNWLFVSENSRFLIQSAVRQEWLLSLNEPVDPSNTFDGMTFQTADILQPLPVTGEKYDLIVVPYLFGFAHGLVTEDQWDRTLENLGKVLAPGGRVILAPGKLDLSKLKESDEKIQTENYQIWLNDLERKGWDVSHSKRYSFHHILGFEPVSAGFSILTPRSELRSVPFVSTEELASFFQKIRDVFEQLPADFKHRNELGYEFKTRAEVTEHLGSPDDNISAAVSEIYQQRGFMMGSESIEDQVSGKPVHARTFWIDPSNPNFRFGALLEVIKRGTEVVADVYEQRDMDAAVDLLSQYLGAPPISERSTMGLAALSSWRALLDETAVMDLSLSRRSELRTSRSQGFGSVNTSSRSELRTSRSQGFGSVNTGSRSELRSDETASQSPAAESISEDSFSRSEAEYSRLIQAIEKMPDSIPAFAEIREFKSYLENEDPQLNTMLRKAMYFYLTAVAEHNGGAYKDKSPRSLYENDKRSWYDLLNNAMQTVSVGLLLIEQLISTAPEKESSQTFFESFLKSAQTMLAMGYMKTQFETNRRADEIEQLFEEQRPKRGAALDPLDKEVPTTFGGPYTLRRIVQHLEVKQGAWFFGPLLYEELGDADRKTVVAALTAETRERLSFFEFIDSAWDEVKPASGQDAGVENLRKRTHFKTLRAALSDIFSFGIRYDAYGVDGFHDFLQIAFEGKVRSPFRGSLTAHPQFASDSAGEHGSFYVIFKHNIQDPFTDQRDHHRWYLVPEQSDKDAISAMAEKAVGKGLLAPEVSADIQSKLVTYQEFVNLNRSELRNLKDSEGSQETSAVKKAVPIPADELKVMRASLRHYLRRQIEDRTIDPQKYEFVSDILPYRILAAKDARGKILGFAFGKKGNRHMHAIVTEKDHEPDGFIYEKDDHGIRIITYVTEDGKNYKEDVFVLGRFGDVYRLKIEESGGHASQQSIEYHNWMPSYMLTKAQEVEALSRVLGPQLYEGVQRFIPENARLVLAPGMEPEARMTYWPSVQGSVRSREEVFGGLDHEGFDVAHIRHQDSTQEQLAEGTAIRSLVNEPGRVQWTFEDNVQSTAIVLSGITLPVGSKRMYVPKSPDDMGRITIGAGGAIQFPEGVEYDVIDTPGEKYRVAFVYTHLALADWVKPGAEVAAGDERTLGTIEKHRRYPYSPVVPHLHFAVMLFKESEIEKYPQLNYEILNRKLGPDQTVLYVNPLSLLDQEQRARLFVEGPEAASGFGSAAIQALNKDSLKSVRARVSHALLGIPVWTAAGPGELTESMLESDAVIRQTNAGWQVRLNGRLSAYLPDDADKLLQDEKALILHLKTLDLKLRQIRETKSRSELRNFDAEDTLTDSASEIGLSSVWEQAWTIFGKRAFSYENLTDKVTFLSKAVFQSRVQDLQTLGLASVERKQNVSGRPLRVRLTNIHENGPQGTERQRQKELAFLIGQLSRPGDEEILRPQIQRVLSGESLFALPLETDSYEDQEIAMAGQRYDFPGLVIVFRTLKKLFGREYVKAVTLAEMLGKMSDRGRNIRALAEDLEALGIAETLRKGSTGSVWIRLSPKLDDSQLGKIEKALLEASRVKGDPSLSFKIRNILERKSAAADMNQSAVIKPSAKASGLFKLTLPAVVRAIEEEEIEQRRQGESEPSVRLNQTAARLGVSITSFHHSLLAEHTDLRRLGIQGLALGLPVDETKKPEPGKKKPLDEAKARPAFETVIREAVSRLRGSDPDFAAIPIRTSILARELGLSDTGLREPLKELGLLPLLDELGVFSFKPASPALEEQAGKFLFSLGLEPSEALSALVLGKSGAKRKVDALSPDVKRVQEILDRWQNEQELRRVQRRKAYVESLQAKAVQHYEAAVSSQSGIEESKKILQVMNPGHPVFSTIEPSPGKAGQPQTEYLVPDENRAAFETHFKVFQTAFLDELTNLKMRTRINFKLLLDASAASDRNLAAEEMSHQRWTSFGSFSLEDIFRAGKKTSAFAAFWKAWDEAEGYPPLAEEMTRRLDVLRRFYQHRSELRITDEETLKKELRKNTSLLHWQLTLSAYLPEKGNDRVDIAIQIDRGIRIRLSAARSLFSDPEFEDAVHRYLAAWIYNLSIVYGTSFAAAGAEEDPSLVDPEKIETLLTKGDLSSIRESLSKGTENPLGIASYANAGRPVRIKRLTELTEEEKEIQPVALQVKLQTQVPGTYLGIDIGGGSAKWAVLQDGKLLDLPKELKSSTTLLMDSASNPVYESPEDYVARLTNRARDILDYLKKTYGIEKIDGVGIDIPGAADFNNNTMVTLGQIPVKKEWNQDQVTWTGREIPRRMAEALGLEPLRVKIRNDMDGVLPGVASVLPAAKKDFWERTGGHFGFDWMGTGHGNQYAVAGVPMNAPTESGHMTFEFGQPGQPLFDTEAYTSIPSMLIYARELVRKSGKGWPEISGDQLKPLADQAFYEGNDNTQLERKTIALKVFKRFAEKYAANLALRYVLAESSGFGNASEILLGGGIARGRTGALLRDLTLKQLRTYRLEQKIRITVIQDDDIRQAGLDPDDVGPAGSAYFIQSLLAPESPDGEEFEIDPGYLESPASASNDDTFQSLARRFEGRQLSWIDPAEKTPGARVRQADTAASFKKYVQWKTGAQAAPLLSDYHFTAGPSEEEIRAFPDLKKLVPDDPDLPSRRPLFGIVSGSFFTNESGQRVFLVSIIQTGVNWKLLERATKNRYDPIRGASLRPEGNLYSWYGSLIAALEETLRAEGVHQIAVLSSEGVREIRAVSGVKIGDAIADKMYGKPGLGYETARVKLRDTAGGEHELTVWKKELSSETSQRSELRESAGVSNRGTLMISASSLSSLTQKGKDELFSRMYLNRANLRLVIFRDGPALSGQALNALLKLPNVFVTAEKDYAAAARKQAIPGASVILLLGEKESLSSGEKRIKGVLLKNQAGEIEFARLLAFNGGSLPNVPEENGVFNPPADFLSDLNQRILSALVVAYSA